MRTLRTLTAAAATAACTVLSLFTAPTAHAATQEYVALGDSYASGTGAGDYSNVLCTRSRNAYPQLWANANRPGTFKFVACGGARIPEVTSQLTALTSDTSLVSVSVGGNDSGFASTITSCLTSTARCESALASAEQFVLNQLPARLDGLYAGIRSRAPRAEVVVLGYPYLYKVGGFCLVMPAQRRAMLYEGADTLNNVIKARAARAGFSFVDARQGFAGHEMCTSDPWVDVLDIHPTAEGHRKGYLPAFTAAAR